MIPKYINCKNKTVLVCQFYMHKDCKESCAYAKEIKGLGVGGMCTPPRKPMTKELTDKLFQEDMSDY